MATIKIRGENLGAFVGCVHVGAYGLDEAADELLACVNAGEAPLEGPDIGFTVFEVPDRLMDDLKGAFAVGWEGLDPGDGLYEQAEEAARALGVSPATPRP